MYRAKHEPSIGENRFIKATIIHRKSGSSLAGLGLAWKEEQEETFEKCSILFKVKEGENLNHRNTLSISRTTI